MITSTVTVSYATHPPLFVTVEIYVVVVSTCATGFAMPGSLSPSTGVQLYVAPPLACTCTGITPQMASTAAGCGAGSGLTRIPPLTESVQVAVEYVYVSK